MWVRIPPGTLSETVEQTDPPPVIQDAPHEIHPPSIPPNELTLTLTLTLTLRRLVGMVNDLPPRRTFLAGLYHQLVGQTPVSRYLDSPTAG